MGIALNHPAEGQVDWYPSVDSNWSTLEASYVARQKSDTSVVTVANTTTETVLMANTTIPANALAAGTTLSIFSSGTFTTPLNVAFNITWNLRWGGVAGTLLWGNGAWGFASGPASTGNWAHEVRLVGVTAGASGTLEGMGYSLVNNTPFAQTPLSTITIDTTTSKVLVWTATMSVANAAASVTQRMMITNRG